MRGVVQCVVALLLVTSCGSDSSPAGSETSGTADAVSDGDQVDDGETLGDGEAEPDTAAEEDTDTPQDAGNESSDDLAQADTAARDDDSTEAADLPPDLGPNPSAESCFNEQFEEPPTIGPDYDQFGPVVAHHCLGTDHQDIRDIERVVFLGDSVTVGTSNWPQDQYYRNLMADRLVERFDLEAPSDQWRGVNFIDGVSWEQMSGDFANCAKWGARTDDLMRDSNQVVDCLPDNQRHKTTLIVFTIGGNDIASITGDGLDGVPLEDIWTKTREFVQLLDDTVAWLREEGRFPNGVHIVFSNMFEFTDGTGDVTACPTAGLAGFGAAWENPDDLADLVIWANEQFMRIAVDYNVDMVFMLESFCGHGWNRRDPRAPCYRGPGTPRWFDITCIHPNPAGHQAISDMFMAVVEQ